MMELTLDTISKSALCPLKQKCQLVAFHELVEWILALAQQHDLLLDCATIEASRFFEAIQSEDFLDAYICDELRLLNEKHTSSLEEPRLPMDLREYSQRVEAVRRAVQNVVITHDD